MIPRGNEYALVGVSVWRFAGIGRSNSFERFVLRDGFL